MTSHLLRLWVIGSYEMPRCDWLQHCNFLAGIEILPIALQTACKPCGFAAGRPAIVAGPVLRVAIGESCSVCRALKGCPPLASHHCNLIIPIAFGWPKRFTGIRRHVYCGSLRAVNFKTTTSHHGLNIRTLRIHHVCRKQSHVPPVIGDRLPN